MISIQHQLSREVKRRGYGGWITLTVESVQALLWWASNDLWKHNSCPIVPRKRSILVEFGADACPKGWGAWLRLGSIHLQTRGFFTRDEREWMINLLELKAQHLGLQALLPLAVPPELWGDVQVRALCDNVTAVKYGRVAVGPSLTMSRQGAIVFDHRQRFNLRVNFEHRAGVLMVEAGSLSRLGWTHIDWVLSRRITTTFAGS